MVKKIKFGPEQIGQVASDYIVTLLKKYSIFTFTGPLGAGKTTMIQNILKQCGVNCAITSPTFGYVNSYVVDDMTYNHFDLYRICSVDEFINLGFDEYLIRKNNVSFIEWPEVIYPLFENFELNKFICDIKIDYITGDMDYRELGIKPR